MERHPATLVAQPQAWGQASTISEGEGGGTESKEGLPMKKVPPSCCHGNRVSRASRASNWQ